MLQHIVFDLGVGCPILKFGHIHIFQRELNPNLFRVDLTLGKQDNRLDSCFSFQGKFFHFLTINTQLDSLIPASKIANLSQGTFVGSVADNFGEEIEQKIFHARIIVDNEKVAAETRAYKKIPVINEFKDADGNDIMQQQIDRNYSRIKADVLQIIEDEMERIANDPDLKHLIPQEDGKKEE